MDWKRRFRWSYNTCRTKERLMENLQPQEEHSFIVQNVTLGPHYISDIRIQFDALEVIDLTWEDPMAIKKSKDLQNSLRKGILKQITKDQWERILDRQSAKEKNELLKSKSTKQTETFEIDGKQLEVEMIDAQKSYKGSDTVTTSGHANDSLSYATALDIVQAQAEIQGREVTAEDFAEMVSKDSGLVPRLLSQNLSAVSGDTRTGKAYVATAPNSYADQTQVSQVRMTNFNKEGYMATPSNDLSSNADFFTEDDPIAMEIDLSSDGDESSDGGIRRL